MWQGWKVHGVLKDSIALIKFFSPIGLFLKAGNYIVSLKIAFISSHNYLSVNFCHLSVNCLSLKARATPTSHWAFTNANIHERHIHHLLVISSERQLSRSTSFHGCPNLFCGLLDVFDHPLRFFAPLRGW